MGKHNEMDMYKSSVIPIKDFLGASQHRDACLNIIGTPGLGCVPAASWIGTR